MSEYLTTEEAAEVIRTSADYVSRQCANGALKAKKLGNQWRISRAALAEFMAGDSPAPPARTRLSARQRRRSA